MPNCTEETQTSKIEFGRLGRRIVQGRFDGASMTSDAAVMLLGAADRKLGLIYAPARCIADPRNPLLIKHEVVDMLRQRVYALALGWEDLNDHQALRQDVAMQTAVGVDTDIATSAPTLCRLEKWADRASAWRLHEVLVDQFIASFTTAPEELVLDFDATDNPLYGQQEGRFFHGYYDSLCYLPLYVFCGQQLLCAYLRPSRIDAAKHSAAILKLLVKRLRQSWPQVRIVFRGDSGFCRQRIINYCERADVGYIIGLARNARLQAITEWVELAMRDAFDHTGVKQREIGEFMYGAQSWATCSLSGCARWCSRAPGLLRPRLIPCASSYSNSPQWLPAIPDVFGFIWHRTGPVRMSLRMRCVNCARRRSDSSAWPAR